MRQTFLVLAALTFLAALAGCACNNGSNCSRCNSAQGKAVALQPAPQQASQQGDQQGPSGTVSYPYYTTRGPRDFLETHPQSIGP